VRATNGTIATFNVPGAGTGNHQGTVPSYINTSGVITGIYRDARSVYHGFVRAANGTMTKLDYPGALATATTCINDSGTIAGWYRDTNGLQHGFVRSTTGTFTSLDPPSAHQTNAWTINTAGVIAGIYTDTSGGNHGFVRATNGTITTCNPPGSGNVGVLVPGGFEMTINTAGRIAGYFLDSGSVFHGYLR